jgi:predicted phosphodiesterase
MNAEKVDFLAELGDFKDQDIPPDEKSTLEYLKRIEKIFSQFNGPRYHVLGNHDVDSISKQQFLTNIVNTGIPESNSFYHFDSHGVRFVVLDANYRLDGVDYNKGNFDWEDTNIPPAQLKWLESVLKSDLPVIVFVHQLLDGTGSLYINNAVEVRKILSKSKNVVAVFQGHKHEGQYTFTDGIHFYTLRAMVDGSGQKNNSYAIVEIFPDFTLQITGYRKAEGKTLG